MMPKLTGEVISYISQLNRILLKSLKTLNSEFNQPINYIEELIQQNGILKNREKGKKELGKREV